MIASVKRSINENETFDHRRAKNILAGHEDNLSETALGDPNKDRKRDFSLPPLRNAEVTTIDKIAMHRNQLYMEPYDAFDPAHPLRGKKNGLIGISGRFARGSILRYLRMRERKHTQSIISLK